MDHFGSTKRARNLKALCTLCVLDVQFRLEGLD